MHKPAMQLTFDATSPRRLGLFWIEVLGYAVDPPPGGSIGSTEDTVAAWLEFLAATGLPEERWDDAFVIVDPDGLRPRIYIQKVPEPKRAKNRLHIDVRARPRPARRGADGRAGDGVHPPRRLGRHQGAEVRA